MNQKIQKILENIPDKSEDKGTTSLKFKEELCEWIIENEDLFKNKIAIELGTCLGYSTRILSSLFKKVITFDHNVTKVTSAKQLNSDRTNIDYMIGDIYSSPWWDTIEEDVGLVLVDADHSFKAIIKDIENCMKLPSDGKIVLVFDDIGAFPDVKRAVDGTIWSGDLKKVKHIGLPPNTEYKHGNFLTDFEGCILLHEVSQQ